MLDRVVFMMPASAPRKEAILMPAAKIVAVINTAIYFVAIMGDCRKKLWFIRSSAVCSHHLKYR
jgi:hypothetical protein